MKATGGTCGAPASVGMVAITAVALLSAAPAAAQARPDTAVTFRAHAGVGIAVFSHFAGAATGGVSFRKSGHVVTARGVAAVAPFNGTTVIDVGVLYGRMISTGNSTFSIGAGLGVVGGVDVEGAGVLVGGGDTREARETVVGLPIEVQIEHGGAFGINIVVFGNVNSQEPFAGMAVVLRVGRLLKGVEG